MAEEKLTAKVFTLLTPADKKTLASMAADEKRKVADYVRNLILDAILAQEEMNDTKTGAVEAAR